MKVIKKNTLKKLIKAYEELKYNHQFLDDEELNKVISRAKINKDEQAHERFLIEARRILNDYLMRRLNGK